MGPTKQQPMTSRRGGIIKAAFFVAFIKVFFSIGLFVFSLFIPKIINKFKKGALTQLVRINALDVQVD